MLPFHALMELHLVRFILHYLIKNNFPLLTVTEWEVPLQNLPSVLYYSYKSDWLASLLLYN